MTGAAELPLVSVLVLSYDRLDLLRQTTRTLQRLQYPALEYVLADDGSPPDMQAQMQCLPYDRFVFQRVNRGLGANTNAGLAACGGSYVLQVQDDRTFEGPPDVLARAVHAFREVDSLGLLRLDLVGSLRELTRSESRVLTSGDTLHLLAPPRPGSSEDQRWLYSDTPHVKSRAAVKALGPYLEGVPMQWSEVAMRERFVECGRFTAGYLDVGSVFRHDGIAHSHRRRSTLQVVGQRLVTQRVTGRATRVALGAYSRTVSRVSRLVGPSPTIREARTVRSICVEGDASPSVPEPGS